MCACYAFVGARCEYIPVVTPKTVDNGSASGIAVRTFQSLLSWMLPLNRGARLRFSTPLVVSILVILDVALEQGVPHEDALPAQVSILVILDVALEPGRLAPEPRTCCWFQSLLSWMLPLNLQVCGPIHPLQGFQSLLSWMLPLNQIQDQVEATARYVSILVILDVALERCLKELAEIERMLFQSLLSWMLPLNTPTGRGSK